MTNKPTWKEELDQLIDRNYPSVRSYTAGKFHSMIKDFISTKLAEQRKEIIEIIKTPLSTEFEDPEEESADYSIEDFRARLLNLIKQD